MKQKQQGLSVPNSYSAKTAKPIIPDKYNNCMNLNKVKRIKQITKELLALRAWGFSKQEVSRCANITSAVENLIVCHKELSTYRECDAVYIEFSTGHPYMVGKSEIDNIGVEGSVTNGMAKVDKICP